MSHSFIFKTSDIYQHQIPSTLCIYCHSPGRMHHQYDLIPLEHHGSLGRYPHTHNSITISHTHTYQPIYILVQYTPKNRNRLRTEPTPVFERAGFGKFKPAGIRTKGSGRNGKIKQILGLKLAEGKCIYGPTHQGISRSEIGFKMFWFRFNFSCFVRSSFLFGLGRGQAVLQK